MLYKTKSNQAGSVIITFAKATAGTSFMLNQRIYIENNKKWFLIQFIVTFQLLLVLWAKNSTVDHTNRIGLKNETKIYNK
jgi:hypothetical protein